MSSAPDWSTGHIVAGRYTVKAALRRGARSSTYSATLGEPPREVVLRVVGKDDAAVLDALAARVGELEALPAPYVLRVLEIATDDDSGARFVASEHARHPSLASLVALGTLAMGEGITLANELARILDAAHDKRVLHLGLKPTNVFVGAMLTGGVEICDFAMPELDDAFEQKRWLAPEQLEGATPTAAADVFATALLVFYAITGKHYWTATTLAELRAEMESPPMAPWKRADELGVTLPPEMDEVFVKAFARAPADRHKRIADFARALDAAPKLVISIPPPPMDLVASLAETENAALGAAEAPLELEPEVIVPVAAPVAPPIPARPPTAVAADAQLQQALPEPETSPLVSPEASRRRRLIVVGVLGAAGLILLLALVVSAFRHHGTDTAPVASASVAPTTTASSAAPVATAPPPQASEAPPPPAVEVDAAPPAPALGPNESELLVLCEPACNIVMVDRKTAVGYPDALKLAPGQHGVGVSSPGCYGDWRLVTTKGGERATVTFVLSKKPAKPATTKPTAKPTTTPPKHR